LEFHVTRIHMAELLAILCSAPQMRTTMLGFAILSVSMELTVWAQFAGVTALQTLLSVAAPFALKTVPLVPPRLLTRLQTLWV